MWKLILLCLVTSTNCGKKKYKSLLYLEAQVDFNPKYLTDHQLAVYPDQSALNITLNVGRNYTRDAWIKAAVYAVTAKETRTIFAYDINICTILGSERFNKFNLLQVWLSNFWKYGNLPRSCPILKGNYFWTGLKIDKINIPTFLSNGKYRLYVYTYFRADDRLSKLNPELETVANVTVLVELKGGS